MRKGYACVADASLEFPYRPGRFGRKLAEAGVFVQERADFALATVIARHERVETASADALRAFGVSLPTAAKAHAGTSMTFLWSGPRQWFALSPSQPDADIERRLAGPLQASCAVFDQSDSRVLVEVWGPAVRHVLAKGCSLDLHPNAFEPGDVALTAVSHLNVLLWQVTDEPRYRIFVVRTWFESFWRWLGASAAEYGGELRPPAEYADA